MAPFYKNGFVKCIGLMITLWMSNAFFLGLKKERLEVTKMLDKMSKADEERLLLSEPALNAFIVAEMRSFLTNTAKEIERSPNVVRKWEITAKEKIKLNLINERMEVINEEYAASKSTLSTDMAIDLLCNTTQTIFHDGYINEQGLLSALGSAILFFKNGFRSSPENLAACEIIGLSDYTIAHHITDMYHHRCFRGTYTKTLAPSGEGEIAARIAVGLNTDGSNSELIEANSGEESNEGNEDECLLWSPTTPGVCLHWKSDDAAWRKKRFERIQMEGTRDPRRGGSGTTR